MQSITKFFSPKKNDKESDFKAAKSDRKTNKNSKGSLLKIVDNEVEDITGLLFGTLNEELDDSDWCLWHHCQPECRDIGPLDEYRISCGVFARS